MQSSARKTIDIDGCDYTVVFNGFETQMSVIVDADTTFELHPWRFHDNLSALGRHVYIHDAKPFLDESAYAFEVLKKSSIPPKYHSTLTPLALWWAAGGDEDETEIVTENQWHLIGNRRFLLRPWTGQERIQALSASVVHKDSDTEFDYDYVKYLGELVKSCIIEVSPSMSIEELDSHTTALLLKRIIRINNCGDVADGSIEDSGLSQLSESQAREILRLCQFLGWSPVKLLSLPASEIDQMSSMLDVIERPQAYKDTHMGSSLCRQPGAVVINITEE